MMRFPGSSIEVFLSRVSWHRPLHLDFEQG